MRRLVSAVLLAVVGVALIGGAVALIGSYTFLPPILESAVAGDIREQLDLTKEPEVRLESDPQPAMLAGTFSDGRVSLRSVDLGGVRAESATVDLDPFDVDVSRSLIQGQAVGDGPLSGALRVRVSGAEITRLAHEAAGAPVDSVRLEGGRMRLGSTITVFGIRVPVTVSGMLDLRDGRLVFEPDGLKAAGVPVPPGASDQLLSEVAFAYPLGELPRGTRITGVRVREGSLVLTGVVRGLRLGGAG